MSFDAYQAAMQMASAASQLGGIHRNQIRRRHLDAMKEAQLRNQFSPAWAEAMMPTSTARGVPGTMDGPERAAMLNLDPEAITAGNEAQAFVARQLVAQAQSDYRVALERGRTAEAEAARVRMEAAIAVETARAAIARADKAEHALAKLQPRIRSQLISPLFAHERRGSYELRWPWLAVSWALFAAGVVVCVL